MLKLASIKTGRGGSWWALMGILVLVAHASLFGVGPVGDDFRTLVEASRGVHPELGGEADGSSLLWFERFGTAGRPLAAWSLGLSSWIWTSEGVWTPFAASGMRFENLLLLVLVAHFLGRLLRRLLVPWTDRDQASAASNAAFLLLLVHPLSVSAVASPTARGDLIAGALGMLACTAFLKGRQERDYLFVALAALLTWVATQASELGYVLPIWLGLIEYTSSRRYRAAHVRLRTGFTTVVAFGAFAAGDVLLRIGLGIDPWPQELHQSLESLSSLSAAMLALLSGLTKLGVLILPVNGANAGGVGFVCAALLLVAVVQPALHAGLSAPRFWITLLGIWLALVLLSLGMRANLHVGPDQFSASAGLFPAVIVMALGLSVASTAVSGSRRQSLPLIIAFLLCALARSNARGWRAAAKDAREFSVEVGELVARGGTDRRYLVMDPPGVVDLYHVEPEPLGWALDRAITSLDLKAEELSVQGLSEGALKAFARLDEFDAWREAGLEVVFANRRVNPSGAVQWVSQALETPEAMGRVLEWSNPLDEAGVGRSLSEGGHWQGADGVRPFAADSAAIELITVRPLSATQEEGEGDALREDSAELFWRARGGVVQGDRLVGVWVTDAQGRQAVFDTGSRLEWLLGPKVDSLLLMGELAESRGADVWARPMQLGGALEPRIDEENWRLGQPEFIEFEEVSLQQSWILTLLDLQSFEYREILCELDEQGVLSAPGAEEISQALRRSPGSLAWGLERRVEGLVIERTGGRL